MKLDEKREKNKLDVNVKVLPRLPLNENDY